MADSAAEVVIRRARVAGIAAAYHLAVTHGIADLVLVERGAPLSLTSDKSTEGRTHQSSLIRASDVLHGSR